MSEIPEPWATRLIERGFTDRRSTRSLAPSYGALADKLDVNTSTISDAVSGKRRPAIETVRMLVRELGPDVADWLGVSLREPYEPPPEADLLTHRQRKAITELIRAVVAHELEGGGEGDAGGAPANTMPDSGPEIVERLVLEDINPSLPKLPGVPLTKKEREGAFAARTTPSRGRKIRKKQDEEAEAGGA